jgi:hypothetical protein
VNDDSVRLPSSFVGGPRYMAEAFQDSMAIIRKFGTPHLFITFTANPEWPEIIQLLLNGQTTSDRPDIIARIFKLKLQALIAEAKLGIFGPLKGYTYVVEFQKRGLPHAHILLFLKNSPDAGNNLIDNIISAEIPLHDTTLHYKVKKYQIHRPCDQNRNSLCHVNGNCRHGFPKALMSTTTKDDNGYTLYRRRNLHQISLNERTIGDEWVVPYSPYLLLKFNAHINVELCAGEGSMKYLYKYLHKGPDMAIMEFENDEIRQYISGRYISASESIWRLMEFNVHKKSPTITRLAIHLEGQVGYLV